MAYPFEETFAAGIPAGFASNGGYGAIAATWNEEEQAADLEFMNTQGFWRLNLAPLATDFWCEMDVEIVASALQSPHFGFWLWTGVGGYEGYRLCVYNGQWAHSYWTSGGSEYEQISVAWAGWAAVGARRTVRLDVKRQASIGVWLLQLSVEGEVIWRDCKRWFDGLQPAIFGYGITLRLHRIAGDAGTGFADIAIATHRRLPAALMQRVLIPEHAARAGYAHRGLRRKAGLRNHYYHGDHQIVGTVKQRKAGAIADAPLARRVLLVDETTWVIVRETWSDAQTGIYRFAHISPMPRYLVMAFDHTHHLRAVVADQISATPMSETTP